MLLRPAFSRQIRRTSNLFGLLPVLLILFAGCKIESRVQVGELRDTVEAKEIVSPTPEADAVFAERADIEKLEEAIGMYESWLGKTHVIGDISNRSAEELAMVLETRDWSTTDYHVLNNLAMAYYFYGISQARGKKEAVEIYEKARTYGMAALSAEPAFRDSIRGGVRVRDSVAHATLDQIDALHWVASSWTRVGEVKGVFFMLRVIPDILAIYERIIELDPNNYSGVGHRGLGAIYCALPKSLGGDLVLGGEHLRRAIRIDTEYLESYVLYAEYYLVTIGDRSGFEEALNIVLQTPDVPGPYQLDNRLARERAEQLLAEADRRF